MPVADGAGETTGVTVGVEANVLVGDVVVDIVGLVDRWLCAQEGAVKRLGRSEILDGIDDGLDGSRSRELLGWRVTFAVFGRSLGMTDSDGGL